MKYPLLAATIFAASFVLAAPAFALTTEQAPTDTSGATRFTDPDEPLDNLSDQLQGQDSSTATSTDGGNMARWLRSDDSQGTTLNVQSGH